MTDRALIFLHVPKTAGATLHRILERQYRGRDIVTVRLLDEDVTAFPDHVPAELRVTASLVKGHVYYGVHEYLGRDADYVTMLRDPVDRVRSLYQFIRTEPRHPLHHEVKRRGLSLQAFVESGIDTDQTADGQVRQLVAGRGRRLSEADLQLASERLCATFAAVGVQEHFDASLLLFRRALGWRRPPFYVARNVTRARPLVVDDADATVIGEHNRLDRELYELARRLVEERRRAAPAFEAELWSFRQLNRIAGLARRKVRR